MEMEVIYDELNDIEIVTCKTKGWSPVLVWISKKDSTWAMQFKTELSRLKGDYNELKNLLNNIK